MHAISVFTAVALMRIFGLQLHKLLFSATLTNNPKKIAALRLNNPHFFSATTTGLYKMPEKLQVNTSLPYRLMMASYVQCLDCRSTW